MLQVKLSQSEGNETHLAVGLRPFIALSSHVCLSFLRASAMLKHVLAIGWMSVRLSVRHTLVLY